MSKSTNNYVYDITTICERDHLIVLSDFYPVWLKGIVASGDNYILQYWQPYNGNLGGGSIVMILGEKF